METIKNIQSLMAFERVAKFESYTMAAKELGVSKSHISKLVQQLEDQLGQRLFNRSTRTVKLTEVGKQFFKDCSASFEYLIKAQNQIIQDSNFPKGRLRITLAGAFGEDFIAPRVAKFIKKYPQVNIELSFEDKIIDLYEGSFDFAVRVGKLTDSSLIAKQIASRKVYICASKNYLEMHGTPKHPNELKAFNCLATKSHWNLLVDGKEQAVPVQGNLKSNNARSILNASLLDLGICCLPGEYVTGHIEEGQLITLLEDFTPNEIPIWLITPSKKNMSTAASAFLKEFN